MMTFFVRPIIRPPANLYKNDGGGGGGEGGGSKIRVSRNGRVGSNLGEGGGSMTNYPL